MNDSKKIKDNPSITKVTKQMKGLDALYKISPLLKPFFPKSTKAFEAIPKLKEDFKIVDIPDNFNERFSELGWIAYESLNVETMKEAIRKYDEESVETAEQFIADSYDLDCINSGILRLKSNKEFQRRIRLIELAKEDYLAERYHACIPLLLSLLDGIVNDISKHVGFFADSVNMTVWDSMAAHETGLQAIASLFTKGRTKTNEDTLTIPYRHGILHGRDLAFDNKLVAAKVWATLFAVRDWADALVNKETVNPNDEVGIIEVSKNYMNTQQEKKQIEEWRPRSDDSFTYLPFVGAAEQLPQNTPERAVAELIENWISKRYGLLAELIICFVERSTGKKAGLAKQDFGRHTPCSYKLISIEDKGAASTSVTVELRFTVDNQVINKSIVVFADYLDNSNNLLVRTNSNGKWQIMQNSFSKIIYSDSLIQS